ncbi:hypothetical protein FGRMN_5731 [Fusarium graminum]|nr:hypothetical protein FGRMN_5731 [Fusarium graminum]
MRSSAILSSLMASVVSADVQLVWQHAKASGQTALSAYDGSSLLAQSCSSFISDASHSIDFSDVDENGFGNFTVGADKYLVHSKAETSGGPICTKKYGADATVVECSGINWKPSAEAKIEKECHANDEADSALRSLTSTPSSMVKREAEPFAMVKREADPLFAPCRTVGRTIRVGDGDPHQNYFHKQLSEVMSCGSANSCSVSDSQSKSFTIGWTATANPAEWISGGFSVTLSWTTGNSYSCSGGAGESVCIWYKTAHTAYTVRNRQMDTCIPEEANDSDPFIIFSPNEANRGGGYYCVVGTCRAQGDGYWDYSGRAGGP